MWGLERKFYDESAPWKNIIALVCFSLRPTRLRPTMIQIILPIRKPHQPRALSGYINKPHNKQGTDLQVVVRGKRYPAKVRVSKPDTWSNEHWLASKDRICNARVVQRKVGWCSNLWKVETPTSSKGSFCAFDVEVVKMPFVPTKYYKPWVHLAAASIAVQLTVFWDFPPLSGALWVA